MWHRYRVGSVVGGVTMTKRRATGVIFIALGVVALLTPWAGAQLGAAAPGPPPPLAQAEPDAGPPPPRLTSEQKGTALKLLASDPRAKKILAGKSYTVEEVDPWTVDRPSGFRVFGASVRLELSAPASYSMRPWAFMDRRPEHNPPYTQHVYHLAADGVTEFWADVDLVRGRVVGMSPSGEKVSIRPGPDFPAADFSQAGD